MENYALLFLQVSGLTGCLGAKSIRNINLLMNICHQMYSKC